MTDKDLNEAIGTARLLWTSTGSQTEAGKKAYSHLTGLMDEQMRRATAKPGSPESSTQ